MRRLTVLAHISLDGVVQAPGGKDEDPSGGFAHGGWIAPFSDSQVGAALRKRMGADFDLLLGRGTYEIWEPYWPSHGHIWPQANRAVKFVASRSRTSGSWGPAVFIGDDIPARVADLKNQDGRELHCWGSPGLVQTLLGHDLVDTLFLMLYPITIGSGKKLFGEGTIPAGFRPVETIVGETGVIALELARAGNLETRNLEEQP